MQVLPNSLSRFVNSLGNIVTPWIQYLQQFTQAPPPFGPITVDISPFSYTAVEPGFVIVRGGTVSAIALDRGSDTLNFTGQVIIPVSIADTVTATYSVLPTMTFIPIYGAAPR
jgi:hypothetical protein